VKSTSSPFFFPSFFFGTVTGSGGRAYEINSFGFEQMRQLKLGYGERVMGKRGSRF